MRAKSISLVIAILFLVVVIATAGYAYFSADIELNANIDSVISTPGTRPTFTSEVNGKINLIVNIQDLTNQNIGQAVANSNSTIDVSLLAGNTNDNVTCSYDIEFVWEGEQYNATTDLPVTLHDEEGESQIEEYPFELSLQGHSNVNNLQSSSENASLTEINLDKLPWKDGDKKIAKVVTGATISNDSANTPTEVTWNFELKFYVLPTPQNQLIKRTFKGYLVVANVVC